VLTLAIGAFVVVNALVCPVLAMDVPVMQIVHVIIMNDGVMAAAGAVGVLVLFCRSVLQHGAHEDPVSHRCEGFA
jgi:hypothetical protein